MDFDLWSFVLDNLEAAGVIGGYVSISIVGVALISLATKGKTQSVGQIGPRWAQPIIGAFFGVIPGCGGTIVVSSMYKNNKISFGGLFAAFITTLGEGSFVLLGASDEAQVAANLKAFFIVNIIGFVVGIILGYVVDAIGYKINPDKLLESINEEHQYQSEKDNGVGQLIVDKYGFYVILAMCAFLVPGSIMALWGGGIKAIEDISIWVAMALTAGCIVYFLVNKLVNRGHACSPEEGFKSTLLHSVADITMVVSYVFIGLLVCNFVIDVLVGPERFAEWMTSSTVVVVLLAALIGATPGCGGMIAVAVAFVSIANFPLAALIAAAIATSGDGIFPLLAENKKDGFIITASGFAVACVVGLAFTIVI